jgi:transposase InsO family protein
MSAQAFPRILIGRLRDECLSVEVFLDLADAQLKIERWKDDYNQQRPHGALADRTQQDFSLVAMQRSFGLSAAPGSPHTLTCILSARGPILSRIIDIAFSIGVTPS